VLVNPGVGVSAGWAYGQFNGQSSATDLTMSSILQALENHDLTLLADVIVNDLQPAVATVHPVIRQAQDALRAAGALVTFMSGSGPTVGGILPPAVDLQAVVASLRRYSAWAVIPFITLSQSFHPELRG
jgi:4-diphosphocytidyl-2-C-methyl-D-erythritol kinase